MDAHGVQSKYIRVGQVDCDDDDDLMVMMAKWVMLMVIRADDDDGQVDDARGAY